MGFDKYMTNVRIILLKFYFSMVFDFTKNKYNKGASKN